MAEYVGEWQAHYARRCVTPERAVAEVQSGQRVWLPVGQQVAILLAALVGRADELDDVEVVGLPGADYGWFSQDIRPHIAVNILYASTFTRNAVNEGLADSTPWWVWGAHKALDDKRADARPIDVTFICVTPPNRQGYCCFGNALWDANTVAKRAKTVVAVVNENLPCTFGDTWIHVSDIDWFVEHSDPLPEARWIYAEPDPWDRPIAEYVASLVKDGDTIQIGSGSTTGNMPRMGVFDDKHDLGYFGELTVPGTIELVKKGVITSRFLDTHPGKVVTTTAGNGASEVEFINGNPMFEFYSVDYMHHPTAISRNGNMVAINNALIIDLSGQIGTGHIGSRTWSGTGGHFAYALGAHLSQGGRYICVLPSTAVGGTVSRIVSQLPQGQVVTIPRDIADIVVTEYGIARLLNKSLRQRANELIAIAHPDWRGELKRAFEKTYSG